MERSGWEETRARDRDLVAACRRGDELAWERIWREYGALVKAVARRTGCTADETDDVLQRAALVALEGIERLRDSGRLAGWLAGIARFQALEVIRQRRPSEEISDSTAVVDDDTGDRLSVAQQLAILHRAFAELESRCRRLLDRLELREPPDSYADVAADEGLSATSIGPIRRRCLDRLRKIVEKLSRCGV